MIVLDATTKSIQAVLAGTPTTELPIVSGFVNGNGVAGSYQGVTSGATAVTAVPAPASISPSGAANPVCTPQRITFLSIWNPTGNSSATVTLTAVDTATTNRIITKIVLAAGDTLTYSQEGGFSVLNSAGSLKESASTTAAANVAALTDNGGGATADGTIGAVTAPTALTDNGGGTADGTVQAQAAFAASVSWNGSSVYPSAADETALTAIALAVRNNMKEITTSQAANRLAIIALTDAVKELSTTLNAEIAALKTAGLQASS